LDELLLLGEPAELLLLHHWVETLLRRVVLLLAGLSELLGDLTLTAKSREILGSLEALGPWDWVLLAERISPTLVVIEVLLIVGT